MDHMDYVGQFLFLNGKNQLQIFEALAFTSFTCLGTVLIMISKTVETKMLSKYLQAEFKV